LKKGKNGKKKKKRKEAEHADVLLRDDHDPGMCHPVSDGMNCASLENDNNYKS
jgi:hypothetical protein